MKNMKYALILFLIAGVAAPVIGYSQVGEKVSSVKVITVNNDTVDLPDLGKKNILLFYADPSHPKQNKDFRNYMKAHPIDNPNVESYGVINMAAAPMIPNSLIRNMAKREIKGTNGTVYFDPDNALGKAWKLKGADDNFAIIFINKDSIIEFYKAGQLTQEEQDQVLALVKKHEKK